MKTVSEIFHVESLLAFANWTDLCHKMQTFKKIRYFKSSIRILNIPRNIFRLYICTEILNSIGRIIYIYIYDKSLHTAYYLAVGREELHFILFYSQRVGLIPKKVTSLCYVYIYFLIIVCNLEFKVGKKSGLLQVSSEQNLHNFSPIDRLFNPQFIPYLVIWVKEISEKGTRKCLIQFATTVFCEVNITILVNMVKYLLSFKSRSKLTLSLTGIIFFFFS